MIITFQVYKVWNKWGDQFLVNEKSYSKRNPHLPHSDIDTNFDLKPTTSQIMKTTKNENSTNIESFLNHRDIKLYKRIMDKIEREWNTIDTSTLSDMIDILGLLNTNIQSHIQKLKNQELYQTSYRKNPKEGSKTLVKSNTVK